MSIATQGPTSCLIHYGINVSNLGTPLKTSALEDFSVDPVEFAGELQVHLARELDSIERATRKVFGVY